MVFSLGEKTYCFFPCGKFLPGGKNLGYKLFERVQFVSGTLQGVEDEERRATGIEDYSILLDPAISSYAVVDKVIKLITFLASKLKSAGRGECFPSNARNLLHSLLWHHKIAAEVFSDLSFWAIDLGLFSNTNSPAKHINAVYWNGPFRVASHHLNQIHRCRILLLCSNGAKKKRSVLFIRSMNNLRRSCTTSNRNSQSSSKTLLITGAIATQTALSQTQQSYTENFFPTQPYSIKECSGQF